MLHYQNRLELYYQRLGLYSYHHKFHRMIIVREYFRVLSPYELNQYYGFRIMNLLIVLLSIRESLWDSLCMNFFLEILLRNRRIMALINNNGAYGKMYLLISSYYCYAVIFLLFQLHL